MSTLELVPPGPGPSILRQDTSDISLFAERRYFPQRDVTIQDEILMTPNFTHFRHLIAQEAFTKCFVAIESLEETFDEATVKSISAMSMWWAELQNESAIFKTRLDQTKTSGTPIEHLREYVVNVQKIDPLNFSNRRGQGHSKALHVIAPVGMVIKKLGRKVSRMSTTLRNQIIVLERVANDLLADWDDGLLPQDDEDDKKFNFIVHQKLNCGKIRDSLDSSTDLPVVSSNAQTDLTSKNQQQRPSATRWQKIRKFILCSKGVTLNNMESDPSIPERFQRRGIRKTLTYELPKITDGIQREMAGGYSIASVSLTHTQTSEPNSDVQINVPRVVSNFATEIEENGTIANTDTDIRTPVASDPASSDLTYQMPTSNANSKTNWLSRSSEDFNNTSDSEPDICDAVTNRRKIEPISELEAFADKFCITLRTSNDVECRSKHESLNANAIEIDDDPSIVSKSGRSKSMAEAPGEDYMTPLKEFIQNLSGMIVTVTEKCRNMELGFLDSKLKRAWCLPNPESKDIEAIIKLLSTTSTNLGDPILANEISDGDKAHMTQKLESMLRAGGKCLHALQDLNYVVNSERRTFKVLVKFCSDGGCKKEQTH